MRLAVQCDLSRETLLPMNCQYDLMSLIYRMLDASSEGYSRFLHEGGYDVNGGTKQFKLFTYSWLRGRQRGIDGDCIRFAPGILEWIITSPVCDFLNHLATGLLKEGTLRVGDVVLPISRVTTLEAPDFSRGEAEFRCLSPIVASVPSDRGTAYYLRPSDGEAFSEAVRNNLIRKHRVLHGAPPADDTFHLHFSPSYMERSRGGTKNMAFKGLQIIGAYCPFEAAGSPDLLSVMYECGAGEKNSGGFGCVEVQ